MDSEIKVLESKVDQVVQYCQSLIEENQRLKQRAQNAEAETAELSQRLKMVRQRVIALIERMPDTITPQSGAPLPEEPMPGKRR